MKKRMELPQKMRFKILILCLACTMTALLLQTWLFNRKSSTLIYNQAKKESFSLLRNMQDDLFTILKSMENNIIKVYNRQQLIRDLKEKESISLLRDKYYRESYNMQRRTMRIWSGSMPIRTRQPCWFPAILTHTVIRILSGL